MMLSVNRVSGGYLTRKIIRDISFDLHTGEIIGLVGLNGAGKSTTLRHIVGTLKPMDGEVTINKQDWYSQRDKLALIPDKPHLYPNLTVYEHFEFIKRLYQINTDDYLNTLVDRYLIRTHINKYPYALSKGTQQKVSIISAMISSPTFLIIDEPFMGLDPRGLKYFTEDLIRLKKEGVGIILSTHMLNIAESLCDRIIVLHEGHQKSYHDIPYLTADHLKDVTLEDIFFSIIEEKR
ncbi:ABC transporter, ATP-binding protein EcsA [Bacillus sp. JCM 19047]|uniref:ABC transporter ATP-binding protein n=1 Tax=Shouchella miscanthi TaxID=2598861 RepID=A0ABU6NEY3_9BACI|nr:ABC transporter ATP-binding protein [Shouchella miscanthi]MED4126753.1 ABC transporter ATP-binding protein [Shouchella miscanthi]GAF24386.1 ABC transporter, ATP-binding protein EcsA [Bacillus sp. JCM 19047]